PRIVAQPSAVASASGAALITVVMVEAVMASSQQDTSEVQDLAIVAALEVLLQQVDVEAPPKHPVSHASCSEEHSLSDSGTVTGTRLRLFGQHPGLLNS
ncbi:MAG TPA: hypothetical protein PKA06_10890, partial [Gemmatales bacterium]|nr:hypothetical protein [Gemmatales bacterium]